jgi:hypothetical protein
MAIPVVRSAVEAATGAYAPDDYSMLQLMAEVGETDRSEPLAVGAYALFQIYTGTMGYWTYEGNTPFMGLENLPDLRDLVAAIGWVELAQELESVSRGIEQYTEPQLAEYAAFTLDSDLHAEIDQITFSERITELISNDAATGEFEQFRRACEYLEQNVEFLMFDDGAALRAWRAEQAGGQ